MLRSLLCHLGRHSPVERSEFVPIRAVINPIVPGYWWHISECKRCGLVLKPAEKVDAP